MHDSRVGRFFAIDPLASIYSWNSPYAFSENRVIDAIELEGLEKWLVKNGKVVYSESTPMISNVGYSSEAEAYKALSILNYPKIPGNQPLYKKAPVNEIRCNCAECQQAKYRYHNLGGKYAIGNPIFVEAALYISGSKIVSYIAKPLSKISYADKAVKIYNKLAPAGKITYDMGTNALSQTLANDRDASKVNVVEVVSSPFPGRIPVVIGESFTLTIGDINDAKKLKDFIPKYPDISTFEGRSKWALQVSGGLLSNSFGKKTDNYLIGENKAGIFVGEFMKFNVETITNASPNAIPEPDNNDFPDANKIRE